MWKCPAGDRSFLGFPNGTSRTNPFLTAATEQIDAWPISRCTSVWVPRGVSDLSKIALSDLSAHTNVYVQMHQRSSKCIYHWHLNFFWPPKYCCGTHVQRLHLVKHWSCSGFLCLVGVDSMTGSNITSSNCGVYITCQILESHQLISCVYHVFSNAWFFTISTKNGVYTVALDHYVKKCVYPGCPGCHADAQRFRGLGSCPHREIALQKASPCISQPSWKSGTLGK